jgi:hypothetical protein
LKSRIEHVLKAAQNLEEAGMHEQAAKLHAEAKMIMEKARVEASRRHARGGARGLAGGGSSKLHRDHEIEALQAEMKELREIVHHLMKRIESYHAERE